MVEQLAAKSSQENYSRKKPIKMEEAYDLPGRDSWEEATKQYLADLKIDVDTINRRHESWDDNKELFEQEREIVLAFLDRTSINRTEKSR